MVFYKLARSIRAGRKISFALFVACRSNYVGANGRILLSSELSSARPFRVPKVSALGHKQTSETHALNVRFTPNSGHSLDPIY
jgi:hypothetical protein